MARAYRCPGRRPDERPWRGRGASRPTFRRSRCGRVEDRHAAPASRHAGRARAGRAPRGPARRQRAPAPAPRRPVELPAWDGNEFRFADGTRPPIRSLTPRRAATGGDDPELDVEIVLHGAGALSPVGGAARARARRSAVAGTGPGLHDRPGRPRPRAGRRRDRPRRDRRAARGAPRGGDRPRARRGGATPTGRVDLPAHPGADGRPGATCPPARPRATRSCPRSRPSTSRPTCACGPRARPPPCSGCVATSSRSAGSPARQAVVRGYWKHGRAGDAGDASD